MTADRTQSTGFSIGTGRFLLVQLWTVSRVPAAVVFVVLASAGLDSRAVVVAGAALLAFIELTDITDGMLARRYGAVSPFGAMLDPFSDSVARLVVFFGLGRAGLVLDWVVVVMAVRDVTVAYCRVVLAGAGRSVSARLGGKVKAWVQGTVAITAWLGPMVLGWDGLAMAMPLSWLVVVVTAWSASDYLRGALPLLADRS